MNQPPSNLYAGLDKALIRATRQPSRSPEAPSPEETLAATENALHETPPPVSPKTDTVDRKHASRGASTLASMVDGQDLVGDDVIQIIRKTVKVPGREVSFVRLSPAEKGQLADIVYTYKRQGKKTSETEINRIAVNYLIADYKTNGEHSVLARVIDALLA